MNDKDKERMIEHWLDAAIGQYGSTEPREGLGTRLLAGLHAEQGRLERRNRWTWALGAAAAATVLATLLVGLQKKHPAIDQAVGKPTPQELNVTVPTLEIADQFRVVNPPHKKISAASKSTIAASITEPKLEQFPSSREASVGEQRLVQYLQARPDAALLKPRGTGETAKLHIDELVTKPLEIQRINSESLN